MRNTVNDKILQISQRGIRACKEIIVYFELTKIQQFQMNMHYEIVDVLVAGSLGDVRNQPNKFIEAYEIGKKF